MIAMTKHSELEDLKKRKKIHNHFWNEIGANEHISLPKLKDAVKKEFNLKDDRSAQAQIELMQTEQRIRVESRVSLDHAPKQITLNFPRALWVKSL